MKTISYLMLMFFAYSCSKSSNIEAISDHHNEQVALRSDLWGFKVNPPNSSPASGRFAGVYNLQDHTLSFNLSYDSLTPDQIHIHKGFFPDNGPVIKELINDGSGQINETIVFSKTEENQLMTAGYYIDFHSRSFPEGEIRGQIEKGN